MYRLIFLTISFLYVALNINAQTVLGCTSSYALNYMPEANINDGTCDFDIPALLENGYCIQELLDGEIYWGDFRGLNYQGGIIVHVDESKGKALICAEEDLSSGINWGCLDKDIENLSNEMYQGFENTVKIVTEICDDTPSAATLCYQSNLNGYSGWFLPTVIELHTAYEFTSGTEDGWDTYNNNNSASYKYLSSIEDGNSSVYTFSMYGSSSSLSNSYIVSKSYPSSNVRPMRYVDISEGCLGNEDCEEWAYGGVNLQPENAGVTCTYPLFECSAIGDTLWNEIIVGVYPASISERQFGLEWEKDLILNISEIYESEGNTYEVFGFEINTIDGLPIGMNTSLQTGDEIFANQQLCVGLTGAPLEEGDFTLSISGTLTMNILGNTIYAENVVLTHSFIIIPNTDGIPGCLYDFAENFNPIATYDDGSCFLSQLIDACYFDTNYDNIVNSVDLLNILSVYGLECE